MYVLQFHRTADVTGYHFLYLDTVGTGTSINLRNAFFGTTVCIGEVITFVHLATHNLEVLDITDMRFNGSLEEIQGSRSVRIRLHHLTACIVHRWHFVHKRHHITQKFHQTAYTHILTGTDTEYREHTA